MKNRLENLQTTMLFRLAFAVLSALALQALHADQLTMLTDFGPPRSLNLSELVEVNGALFFRAGTQLWKSDGSAAGTVLVKDSVFGGSIFGHARLVNVNGTLFFQTDSGNGDELWKSDGTAGGTVLVRPAEWCCGQSLLNLMNVNGILFFTVDYPAGRRELWKSDGTVAGTVLVKAIAAGNSSSISDLVNVNGMLFFRAYEIAKGVNGYGLWKSDGTTAGTVVVKAINQFELVNVNGTLFFSANDGRNGYELWRSDGTAAGTVLVKNINPGTGSLHYPSELIFKDAVLYTRECGRVVENRRHDGGHRGGQGHQSR